MFSSFYLPCYYICPISQYFPKFRPPPPRDLLKILITKIRNPQHKEEKNLFRMSVSLSQSQKCKNGLQFSRILHPNTCLPTLCGHDFTVFKFHFCLPSAYPPFLLLFPPINIPRVKRMTDLCWDTLWQFGKILQGAMEIHKKNAL